MQNYIEIQSRKKSHELALMVYRNLNLNSRNKIFSKIKTSADSIPAELFEAHGRLFDDEKLKHVSSARGYLFEVKYYVNLLSDLGKINRYIKRQMVLKIDLLDKLLLSMIRNSNCVVKY